MLNKSQIKLIDSICKKYKVDFMIVFGSYAKNTQKPNSDIDLAYFSRYNINYQDLFEELVDNFEGKNIDLIKISIEKPIRLRQTIFREGILIYFSDKHIYNEVKLDTYMEFIDFSQYDKIKDKYLDEPLHILKKKNLKTELTI